MGLDEGGENDDSKGPAVELSDEEDEDEEEDEEEGDDEVDTDTGATSAAAGTAGTPTIKNRPSKAARNSRKTSSALSSPASVSSLSLRSTATTCSSAVFRLPEDTGATSSAATAPMSAKWRRQDQDSVASSASSALIDHLMPHGLDNPSVSDLQRRKLETEAEEMEKAKWYETVVLPQLITIATVSMGTNLNGRLELPGTAHREAARLSKGDAKEPLLRLANAVLLNPAAQAFLRPCLRACSDELYSLPAHVVLTTLRDINEATKK